GKPIHQEPDEKDEEGTFERLLPKGRVTPRCIFPHDKCHGIADGKQKGGKDKISRSKSMPRRMRKGSIQMTPASRRVDDNHEAYRHTTKYIKRNKAILSRHSQ